MLVKVSALRCGDKVQLFEGAYGTASVVQVEDESCRKYEPKRTLCVKLWRPYMQTGDVGYAGDSVIPGIGLEIVVLMQDDTREVERLECGPSSLL